MYYSFSQQKPSLPANPPHMVLFLVVTIITIVAVLALLLILVLLNQKRQRLFEESLATLKLDHEKNILRTQMEIHEQTLKNVSREIHDNIHLSLIMAKMNLFELDCEDRKEAALRSEISVALIGNAIADLSAMSRSLNSDLIKSQGLIKALQLETERIQRCTRLNVTLSITGEPIYMTCDKEVFVFRIVQEAFNNVLKHARAKSVWLNLHYNCAMLELRVRDDGQGFDGARLEAEKGPSTGLASIKTRAWLLNGTLALQTAPGKGTELFLTIPFD